MEFTYNVPSIEQISFKLTENLIPSISNLHNNRLLDDSLDYTLSKPSIQNMIFEDEQPANLLPQLQLPEFWKNNSLKTTCTGTTQPSTIKKTSKVFFRQRIISSSRPAERQPLKRRLSHHIMSIGDQLVEQKLACTPLHSPHPAPYRPKERKKNTCSGKYIKTADKVKEIELLDLHSSMKVHPLALEADTVRQKIYLRRVMQNRGSVALAIDEVSRHAPVWTSKRSFRIH